MGGCSGRELKGVLIMGMFATTMAFRRPEKMDWEKYRPRLEDILQTLNGAVTDLSEDTDAYGYLSFDPEDGMMVPELLEAITLASEDFGVCAQVCDSDFCLLQLYHCGVLLQECALGNVYEEYAEIAPMEGPKMDLWLPLLKDEAQKDAFLEVFEQEWVFAEDGLRELAKLTGLPLLDDSLMEQIC